MMSPAALVFSELAHVLLLAALLAWLTEVLFARMIGARFAAMLGFALGAILGIMPDVWGKDILDGPRFGLIIAMLALLVAYRLRELVRKRYILIIIWLGILVFGVGIGFLPEEANPVFYTRAVLGDPGALAWVFLLHLLLQSVWRRELLSPREGRALAIAAVAGAVLIYPASLGVPGAPDFYNANFGGFVLPTAALGFALFCLWRGFLAAAAGVSFGLFLYGFNLHESANLWDCLIDFPSVLVSAVLLWLWWRGSRRRLLVTPDGVSLHEASTES